MSQQPSMDSAIREGEPPYGPHLHSAKNPTWGRFAARHSRLLLVLAILSFSALTPVACWYCIRLNRLSGSGVTSNELVGRVEEDIRRKYGEPESDRAGYRCLGPVDPPLLPKGEI